MENKRWEVSKEDMKDEGMKIIEEEVGHVPK